MFKANALNSSNVLASSMIEGNRLVRFAPNNKTMNEALLNINKEEIEVVKNVLQRVYDNLTHKDLI